MWRTALLAAILLSFSQSHAGDPPTTQLVRQIVTVRTLDSQQPLAGAKVTWDIDPDIKGSGVTNAAGDVAIDGIPANCKWGYLKLSLDGWVPLALSWNGTSDRDQSGNPVLPKLNFLAEKSHEVSGSVVDESGAPIAGANVFVLARKKYPGSSQSVHSSWEAVKTDAHGHWTSAGVPANPDKIEVGAYDVLHLTNEYFQTPEFKPISSLFDGTARLTLPSEAPIEVTVRTPHGSPAAGAEVFLGTNQDVSNCIDPAKADAMGKVTFGCKPGMGTLLTATLAGFAPAQADISGKSEPQKVALSLTEEHPRSMDVVDSQGKPILGATIRISKWRGNSVLSAELKTDAAGHAVWPSGPADDVAGELFADGFMQAKITWSPGPSVRVVMLRPTPIIGRVVDAKTGEPITGFTIRAGAVWNEGERLVWQNFDWGDTLQAKKQRGGFSLELTDPAYRYQLRVYADNYLPTDSDLFALDGNPANLEFRLSRGESISGTVVNQQNQPVAGAEVYIVAPDDYVRLQNGDVESYWKNNSQHVTSDKSGRFVLPPQNHDFELLALSDFGSTILSRSALAGKPPVMRLSPWAKLSGTMLVNGKPVAALEVSGEQPAPSLADGSQPLRPGYYFTTDQNGQFDLPRVGAGPLIFKRGVPNHAPGRFWYISIGSLDPKPGETYHMNFGQGTTVTGRMLIPPGKPWMVRQSRLEPTGRPHLDNWENVEVFDDGTFHADGLAPGDYTLHVALHEFPPNNDCGWGRVVGVYDKEITISPGRATFDIGQVAAEPIIGPNLQVNDAAPDFTVRTLDGSVVRLSDLRGKAVLLDFWATWCAPCVAEIPNMQKIQAAYAGNNHFAMISLSLDENPEDLQRVVKLSKISWPQAFVGVDSDPVQAYGATAIPATFVISPEGRILARDLRGPELDNAIKAALGK